MYNEYRIKYFIQNIFTNIYNYLKYCSKILRIQFRFFVKHLSFISIGFYCKANKKTFICYDYTGQTPHQLSSKS